MEWDWKLCCPISVAQDLASFKNVLAVLIDVVLDSSGGIHDALIVPMVSGEAAASASQSTSTAGIPTSSQTTSNVSAATSVAVGGSGGGNGEQKMVDEPAEIVRRDEVCFEQAWWRMTETDGQIGLADVSLRRFLYARTHRRDDSGSHWCELGSVWLSSVAPSAYFKVVCPYLLH